MDSQSPSDVRTAGDHPVTSGAKTFGATLFWTLGGLLGAFEGGRRDARGAGGPSSLHAAEGHGHPA